MAGQFKTTHEEMVALSNRVDDVNGAIQGQISRLQGVIDSVESGWKGAAATSYNQLQSQVNQDANKLNQVLGEIKTLIDESTKAYAATEEEQQASMRNVAAQSGDISGGSPFG